MSHANEHAQHGDHAHSHGHDDHDDVGYHASVGGYAIGFLLSVILTAIPFWLVMNKVIESSAMTAFVILAFAVVQIVVHMVFFLHMDAKSEGGWNMLALIFTLVLLLIMLAGSLWVMHHMNTNMMPHPHAGHEMSTPQTTPAAEGADTQDDGHQGHVGHDMKNGHSGHDMKAMEKMP